MILGRFPQAATTAQDVAHVITLYDNGTLNGALRLDESYNCPVTSNDFWVFVGCHKISRKAFDFIVKEVSLKT